MADPDSLDVAAQMKLVDTLHDIKHPNITQAVLAASQKVGGRGLIPRYMRASRGPGKISLHEYVYYRLFDPAVPEDELTRFVGGKVRVKQMFAANMTDWAAAAYDKVLWDMILGAAGLPRPALKAVFRTGRPAEGTLNLGDAAALEAFLRDPAHYPMLAKPNNAGRSLGILSMAALDGDSIVLHDGSVRSVGEVIGFLTEFLGGQYLFQELLRPHPEIARLTGGSLATIRVMVLYRGAEAAIENITIKLPSSGALADNYWRSGNMIGAVDAQTGALTRVVTGSGLELAEITEHLDTGEPFADFRIPDLDAVGEFCRGAAPVFPGITMQAWDIALTDRGPVPVELNFRGDVNLQQLAHGRGAMTPAYCEHLRQCGYKGVLPT